MYVRCRLIHHCDFYYISLIISDIEHLFMYLFGHLHVFFGKMSVQVLFYFFSIGWYGFLILNFMMRPSFSVLQFLLLEHWQTHCTFRQQCFGIQSLTSGHWKAKHEEPVSWLVWFSYKFRDVDDGGFLNPGDMFLISMALQWRPDFLSS